MKKSGFTLSEILVALGIIGAISAITIPMLGNIVPDQDKMKVLKCYKTIVEITQELINDPALYYGEDCVGFACSNRPEIEPYKNFDSYEGPQKFPTLFLGRLDITNDQTNDGIWWNVTVQEFGHENLHFLISVDLNGADKGPNESYSSTQKNPDRFVFKVTKDGSITGNDALTKVYLKNPYNLNDKKKDYETAKNLK